MSVKVNNGWMTTKMMLNTYLRHCDFMTLWTLENVIVIIESAVKAAKEEAKWKSCDNNNGDDNDKYLSLSSFKALKVTHIQNYWLLSLLSSFMRMMMGCARLWIIGAKRQEEMSDKWSKRKYIR